MALNAYDALSEAESLTAVGLSESISSLGAWRLPDGTIAVAAYHFGPVGDVLFLIRPDGTAVEYPNELP
ncbi:hypothetical protein [Rhizobium phage RHph_X2_25]|nr:hypothetical protein [Rhizobium phage RHph_X2_25]